MRKVKAFLAIIFVILLFMFVPVVMTACSEASRAAKKAELSPAQTFLEVGQTEQITVDGYTGPFGRIVWISNDNTVAMVEPTSGEHSFWADVTAISAGETTIIVRLYNGRNNKIMRVLTALITVTDVS